MLCFYTANCLTLPLLKLMTSTDTNPISISIPPISIFISIPIPIPISIAIRFGQGARLCSFTSSAISVRRADGTVLSEPVSSYVPLLFKYALQSKWQQATRLARFVNVAIPIPIVIPHPHLHLHPPISISFSIPFSISISIPSRSPSPTPSPSPGSCSMGGIGMSVDHKWRVVDSRGVYVFARIGGAIA